MFHIKCLTKMSCFCSLLWFSIAFLLCHSPTIFLRRMQNLNWLYWTNQRLGWIHYSGRSECAHWHWIFFIMNIVTFTLFTFFVCFFFHCINKTHRIWTFLVETTRTSKLAVIITTHYIDEARQANSVCISDYLLSFFRSLGNNRYAFKNN